MYRNYHDEMNVISNAGQRPKRPHGLSLYLDPKRELRSIDRTNDILYLPTYLPTREGNSVSQVSQSEKILEMDGNKCLRSTYKTCILDKWGTLYPIQLVLTTYLRKKESNETNRINYPISSRLSRSAPKSNPVQSSPSCCTDAVLLDPRP
ncbi:hypothetical protein T310_2886 [Rasamsonia emersonii CBS 393.64]|uniref:Uncharacterized protein n=1 Tax=Rasamsonia emersonii (strain ATCC 16479 / CBS 393.64 / IMI 116815) TaxID=1408163 RepID=A0A0F4YYK1_RASE3|nr:hypothetical protein T310_2886 [Rasamsonia emersonii CBS 393.64]KKA23160.1 hypothetical protein T310_2886 [Rasamsonia emersonii CBS 393.64]